MIIFDTYVLIYPVGSDADFDEKELFCFSVIQLQTIFLYSLNAHYATLFICADLPFTLQITISIWKKTLAVQKEIEAQAL